jgi:hypothetical protein
MKNFGEVVRRANTDKIIFGRIKVILAMVEFTLQISQYIFFRMQQTRKKKNHTLAIMLVVFNGRMASPSMFLKDAN